MSAPYFLSGAFGETGALVAALVLGLAFGWFLERAGLGSARKLVGQFYLTDLTVFKVMFSAIITALLGAFWLSRLGVLDLGAVFVPETYVFPQLVGGIVFGVGMVVGGLCPGTSCVAASTGRTDGVFVALGMLVGVAVFNESFFLVEGFYTSTPMRTVTLPQLLGVPEGPVVLGVVTAGLGGFRVAERLERRG
jgi:uncharacterized membrane protein YedE/YeeE